MPPENLDNEMLLRLLTNLQTSTESLSQETKSLNEAVVSLEMRVIPLVELGAKVAQLEVRIASLEVDRIKRDAVTSTLMKVPTMIRGIGAFILVGLGYVLNKLEVFK